MSDKLVKHFPDAVVKGVKWENGRLTLDLDVHMATTVSPIAALGSLIGEGIYFDIPEDFAGQVQAGKSPSLSITVMGSKDKPGPIDFRFHAADPEKAGEAIKKAFEEARPKIEEEMRRMNAGTA